MGIQLEVRHLKRHMLGIYYVLEASRCISHISPSNLGIRHPQIASFPLPPPPTAGGVIST